jgi:hypothetical protein
MKSKASPDDTERQANDRVMVVDGSSMVHPMAGDVLNFLESVDGLLSVRGRE